MPIPKQYFDAGRIAARVREDVKKRSFVGRTLFEICEHVENMVVSNGGLPAFPCNTCLNSVAAHYTPLERDGVEVKETDLLKIDIGVHVDGYIADTAVSVSHVPEHEHLVHATESALAGAIGVMRSNIRAGFIGETIYNSAIGRGFKPISNLSGHSLERHIIHAGKSIPNVWVHGTSTLEDGEVYAVEPFLTKSTGAGYVVEGELGNIYSLLSKKRSGDKSLDELLDAIWNSYKTLPFTARWLTRLGEPKAIDQKLRQMTKRKNLRAYPILIEGKGEIVAQAEHTVAVSEGTVHLLTV